MDAFNSEHDGEPVLTLYRGWGVSTSPYLSCDLMEGKAGDPITVRWVDNACETGRVFGAGEIRGFLAPVPKAAPELAAVSLLGLGVGTLVAGRRRRRS